MEARFTKSCFLRCFSPPKLVMAMSSSSFPTLGRARYRLALPLSQQAFAGMEMKGAVLLLPGWILRSWIISALVFCQKGQAMDLACSLQQLSSAVVAQKPGCKASNQLEGFLLNILSSAFFCKPPLSSKTVNFGSSAPSSSTYFKLCQSWPEL